MNYKNNNACKTRREKKKGRQNEMDGVEDNLRSLGMGDWKTTAQEQGGWRKFL